VLPSPVKVPPRNQTGPLCHSLQSALSSKG